MKYFIFKLTSAFTLGLALTLTVLGLMTYLHSEAALAAGPHHVAPNCAGVPTPCYTNVQAAVDAAAPGDVIMVAAGTYTGVNTRLSGAFNIVLVTQTLYLSKNVTIRGGYTNSFIEPPDPQANPTILDAQGQGRVIYAVGVSPTIEGLQLINGNARVAGDPLGNPASYHGGGLFALSGDPVFSSNIVINNVADYGGGVDVFSGGATLSHNVIATNTALIGGGGVHVSSGTVTMNSNQVMSNTSPLGGGIYGGSGDFNNNIFIGNIANYGGALYLYYSTLTNNIVADNQAAIAASGAYLTGFSQLFHNTFAHNSSGDGTGIYVTDNFGFPSSVALTNTILVSQTIGITVTAGNTTTLNSTLWNGNATDWGGAGTINAANNYSGSPAFINPAGGDYHLGPTSAAIDKGINAGVPDDIDGDPRPQGAAPDLGADESPAAPTLSIGKSGPLTSTPGSPITYTLTVTNSGSLTAANLVITDAIPAGASYVNGGTKVGSVVSWTVSSLAGSGGVTQTSFVVTATQTITNSDYGVRADGGYGVQGSSIVVTLVSTDTAGPKTFLPVIVKQ